MGKDTSSPANSKRNLLIAVIIIVIVAALVATYFFKKSSQVESTPTESARTISLEEISTHNSKDSCWTTINGGVYDVTAFIPNHKGGERILNACGKDATDLFTGKSPMGRVHSSMAIKLLSGMKIGNLQN